MNRLLLEPFVVVKGVWQPGDWWSGTGLVSEPSYPRHWFQATMHKDVIVKISLIVNDLQLALDFTPPFHDPCVAHGLNATSVGICVTLL